MIDEICTRMPAPNTEEARAIFGDLLDPQKYEGAGITLDQLIINNWSYYMEQALNAAAGFDSNGSLLEVEPPDFEKYLIAVNIRGLARKWVKKQQKAGWKLPNGEPIRNASAVFLAYCEAIGRRATGGSMSAEESLERTQREADRIERLNELEILSRTPPVSIQDHKGAGALLGAGKKAPEGMEAPLAAEKTDQAREQAKAKRSALECELNAICSKQNYPYSWVHEFIEMNGKHGWRLPSGEPIINRGGIFTNFCKHKKECLQKNAELLNRINRNKANGG